MPKFGRRSKERLKGVHPDLVNIVNDIIKYYDITILEGVRSQDRQIDLYNEGKSKLDGVYKKSKHQTGRALDISPYPIDFEDTKGYMYLAGLMIATAKKLGVKIRWGGDWNGDHKFSGRPNSKRTDKTQRFDDLVHFELK